MDKIEKFLKKLPNKEYEAFLLLMYQLKNDYKKIPGIKKLSSVKNVYRIRLGIYRIIFTSTKGKTEIIKIVKRDEQTYKNI
ncbi:MAG: type II toxin-antitoxin system RelE/ParE family toxin [Candidatus Gracilibacteria bacterium]|jgi:mRNA-degrading endonuclease RelE of RelBE toxin-antitoxin system